MRKYIFLIFSLIIFIGCDKISDDIVDSTSSTYSVINVEAPVVFTYSASDSTLVTSLEVDNKESILIIWFNILFPDGTPINTEYNLLRDTGSDGDITADDKIFTGKFDMSMNYPNGNYKINYYILNISDEEQLVAAHNFEYDNGQVNYSPEISNLNIPGSINRSQEFTFTIAASDPNGMSDIYRVFYELYDPSGAILVNSQGISQFAMYDNGDTDGTGDVIADDGTYSFKLTFPNSVAIGTWEFKFQAEDFSGEFSEILNHFIEVN